jgi:cytochrome c6
MQRKPLTMVLVVFAASAVGLTLLAGPAAAKGNVRTAAHATTVITVTAGKPTELAFKLSKSSSIAIGSVTFKVTNQGALAHNFKVCTLAVTSSSKNACVGKSTALLKKGQSAVLTVNIKKAGQYEYLCTVPGHASAGMKGLVGVGVKVTTTPAKTTPTTSVPTGKTTTTGAGSSGPPKATETLGGSPSAGAAVWASAGCGSCHTLKAAGATGQVGPNLDSSAPGQDLVIQRVTNGINVMPAFNTTLSGGDITNLAAYVYQSTHV